MYFINIPLLRLSPREFPSNCTHCPSWDLPGSKLAAVKFTGSRPSCFSCADHDTNCVNIFVFLFHCVFVPRNSVQWRCSSVINFSLNFTNTGLWRAWSGKNDKYLLDSNPFFSNQIQSSWCAIFIFMRLVTALYYIVMIQDNEYLSKASLVLSWLTDF